MPSRWSPRHAALAGGWLAACALASVVAYAMARVPGPGPVLAAAQARGTLVVGVRQYARPAPPKAPSAPEPDHFDVAAAQFLADRLGVGLRVVGLPGEPGSARWQAAAGGVDLVVAGATASPAPRAVPSPYATGGAALLVLRGSRYRRAEELRGQPVCVAQGSPYAAGLASAAGTVPKVYASSIRAASGFLAGECQALADDEPVIARLGTLPEWRFYRALPGTIEADADGARIVLSSPDSQSAAWLDRAVADWRRHGALDRARAQRAGDVAYEASQLQDGLVCHS
ncbi:type 2 periplasmic-binding domain-containing protein [Cupriavidus agavae]|uniref:Amino acid ABC transporter substrate-binding protein (PAAT family) n=1 Tax=Cupriavidus agavae TaxID=1001822 RepID=A0A4Q7S151_9BURK|nr:transporter substrate-binding domain-containing protein [Cupriavidus agavae]RZT39100.1 amino acid ABC transporter substrate-binding protein (PAAT family) [Cupriavidus agavae]